MKIRYALVAAALAGALAPLTAPAQAMVCHPAFQDVCSTAGIACRAMDNDKFAVTQCPPMG